VTQGRHRRTPQHRAPAPHTTNTVMVTGAAAVILAALPGTALADDGTDWAAVARCESGGNPAAVDPSGQHLGMYQFTRSTWASNGGRGDPRRASSAEQTRVAENVKRSQGMGAWPVCGRHAHDGPTPGVTHPGSPRHASTWSPTPPRPVVAPSAEITPAPPTPEELLLTALALDTTNVTTPPPTYRVGEQDTLWGIAAAQHVPDAAGTPGWQRIADANPGVVSDAAVIQPGWALNLPT
jgi:hypothetical protein